MVGQDRVSHKDLLKDLVSQERRKLITGLYPLQWTEATS